MLFAHWMLLIATFLPIIAVGFAKWSRHYDNQQPRAYLDALPDNTFKKRMVWAHNNSWEALMMFAPAVLLATFVQAKPSYINLFAGLFIVARLAYLVCFGKNWATARSVVWFVGVAAVVALYVISAMA